LKLSAPAAVTPSPAIIAKDLALVLAYIQGNTAATSADTPPEDKDDDMEDANNDKPAAVDNPQPVPLQRSLELLPPAFTLFSETISKKVANLLMAKRAKLRIITKLEQQETIPKSIRIKRDHWQQQFL
jgi:hypothetical protein